MPRTILITGASSGLGAALAKSYAQEAVTLILTGRHAGRLEEVALHCQQKGAQTIVAIIDIAEKNAGELLSKLVEGVAVDLVIANAGVSGGTAGGPESDAQTRQLFATNLEGMLNTILPILPAMRARKSGQIALVSSLAGYRGLPSAPAYSASKGAVRLYGEALRGVLMKENIGVTVITPGYIKTPMTDVNNFPMPGIISAEKAAAIIKRRLQRNPARIAFPFPLFFLTWLLSCLSPTITDPLFSRLPGKTPL